MIIWRGWGIITVLYALAALVISSVLKKEVLPGSFPPVSFGILLLLAAIATWFTGTSLNRTRPKRKIDLWVQGRRAQLDDLVLSGRFSLGPGQPQPTSIEEARSMSDALLTRETEEATRTALNRHTWWILTIVATL